MSAHAITQPSWDAGAWRKHQSPEEYLAMWRARFPSPHYRVELSGDTVQIYAVAEITKETIEASKGAA